MIKIIFNKEKNRSLAYDNETIIGECIFLESNNSWNIVHTGVNSSHQGQGIARKLVECVINEAKKNNKSVTADCSYAKKILLN